MPGCFCVLHVQRIAQGIINKNYYSDRVSCFDSRDKRDDFNDDSLERLPSNIERGNHFRATHKGEE